MKKGLVVLIVLAGLYFVYLGGEAETPEYNIMELAFEDELARPLGLTLVEKMPPGQSCNDGVVTPLGKKVKSSCGLECRIAFKRCSLDLNTTYSQSFQNQTLNEPYLAYDKGGAFKQQDFRLFYTGLDRTEMEDACLEMRDLVGNDLLFLIGGRSDCVRRSITR